MQDGGKRKDPIETYHKIWNLNPLTADRREILRIPAWKGSYELVKRELEMTLERERERDLAHRRSRIHES